MKNLSIKIIALCIALIVALSSKAQSGKLITTYALNKLLSTGNIQLKEGTYCFPVNFSYDFGDKDITIQGVPGKTIITSYDSTQATDFKPKLLDTNLPDLNEDGLYVVYKHPIYPYGGGFAHIELPYNTGGLKVWYTQGTILQRKAGVWVRHYTGYGFKTTGNVIVRDVIFDNCQFYLFSPFGQKMSKIFSIENSYFKNIGRVIASCKYDGIDHKPDWYNALNYYNVSGTFRFDKFNIQHSTFENIHTSIVWGFPPSRFTFVKENTIKDCSTMIAAFNFFMKWYGNENYFTTNSNQIITGNIFKDIVQTNNWTTALIRTSGISTVSDNQFINCTPQIVLLYGGNSINDKNIIDKINTPTESQSPVFLVKCATAAKNTFSNNIVFAPQSLFVALEGPSNTTIQGNDLTVKTVFSKNDATPGNSQVVSIINNPSIVTGTISHIHGNSTFRTVTIKGNSFTGSVTTHTGSTPVSNYIFSDNNATACYFTAPATGVVVNFISANHNNLK